MKDGMQARTLEDLQENFDLEKVVGYFGDGRLQTWLEERYYEEEAEAVSKLSKEQPDFHKKLCAALGVTLSESELPEIDVEELEYRKKRLEHLRQYTADKNILDKLEYVAFNQEELGDLLADGASEIILCNNNFRIPLKQKGKTYIGVGRVEVVIKSVEKVDWDELKIKFKNVKFDAEYDKLENQTSEQLLEKALQVGDEEEKIKLLQKAVDMGNSEAMYEFGKKYEEGKGVKKDIYKAVELYRKAADLGNTDAMVEIADVYYDNDNNYENSEKKAFEWYMKAAKQGSTKGMANVGVAYYKGMGVNKDIEESIKWLKKSLTEDNKEPYKAMAWLGHVYSKIDNEDADKEAFKWYKKAAELNDEYAYHLAKCYNHGLGCNKDIEEAKYWYKKAADHGDGKAMNNLGLIFGKMADDSQDSSMTAEFRKQEIYWYEKAVEQGDAAGMCNLGYCYHYGIGVNTWKSKSQRLQKALELYRGSAEKNYIHAMVEIGNIFLFEDDHGMVPYLEVKKWLEKAVSMGNGEAMYDIGYMFESGKGVAKSYKTAFEWYKKSMNAGYDGSITKIGLFYEEGKGCTQNFAESARLYKMAADKGDPFAMRLIGRLYYNGNGVSKDVKLALQWWQRSANAGDEIAKKWIEDEKTGKGIDVSITGGIAGAVASIAGIAMVNWLKNK